MDMNWQWNRCGKGGGRAGNMLLDKNGVFWSRNHAILITNSTP